MIYLTERDQLVMRRLGGEVRDFQEVQVPGLVQLDLLLPEVSQDNLVGARQARHRYAGHGLDPVADGPRGRKLVRVICAHGRRPQLVVLGPRARRRRTPHDRTGCCPGLAARLGEGARRRSRHGGILIAGVGSAREPAHDGRHHTRRRDSEANVWGEILRVQN